MIETRVIEVFEHGDGGGEARDARQIMVPREEAYKLDRNLKRSMQIERPPILDQRPTTTRPDGQVIALEGPIAEGFMLRRAAAQRRYELAVAGLPPNIPVQRYHGQTWRDPGWWVVSGPDIRLRRKVLRRREGGGWTDVPRMEWQGPYLSVEEAEAAEQALQAKLAEQAEAQAPPPRPRAKASRRGTAPPAAAGEQAPALPQQQTIPQQATGSAQGV